MTANPIPSIDDALDLYDPLPFTEDDLERYFGGTATDLADVDADDMADLVERVGRYSIDSLGAADAIGRRRRAAQARVDEIAVHVAQQKRALDLYLERATRADKHRVEWADQLLTDWAIARREVTGINTQRLPSVSMTGTRVQPKVVVKAPSVAAFATWARENCPAAIRDEVLVSGLKSVKGMLQVVERDGAWVALYGGEEIPGAEVELPGVSAKVRATHDHATSKPEWVSVSVKSVADDGVLGSALGDLEAVAD
jgi:hypothetical protein